MEKRGHEITIAARNRDLLIDLLNTYDFAYFKKSNPKFDSLPMGLSYLNYLKYEYETFKIVEKINPDICMGVGIVALSHVSTLLDIPSILFTDTEHAKVSNLLSFPFVDYVCTPDCYLKDFKSKQISYPSYHELAYLHPKRFTPDSSVLDYINADKKDQIVVLRSISWGAVHDVGHSGFKDITGVVSQLQSTGARVVITSEGDFPKEVEDCQYKIPSHKLHDLMYYSDLFIGEGGTMASESAVLGTPAIFISTLKLGYLEELEKRYGLVYNFSGPQRQEKGLQKAVKILNDYKSEKWNKRRKKLLKDKIDLTKFMIQLLENYPKSLESIKNNYF